MLRRLPGKVASLQRGCEEERGIPQGVMGHTYTDGGVQLPAGGARGDRPTLGTDPSQTLPSGHMKDRYVAHAGVALETLWRLTLGFSV